MANASNAQTSFLGGEWSPYAQGNFEEPEYKRGMNVCRNLWPIESGAAVRRSGTKELAFTRKGQVGKLLPFAFTNAVPYTMEFTDGVLRFYNGEMLVISEEPRQVLNINTASPARLTTTAACGTAVDWAAGDTVIFNFPTAGASAASGILTGRQYTLVAGGDQADWLLYDAVTGAPLDGSLVQWDTTLYAQVARVFEIATPYSGDLWASLRAVQDGDSILLLHPTIKPYVVFSAINGGNLFTFNPAAFIDGPYLDPPTDGSYLTTTGTTGTITLQINYPAWSNTATYPDGTYYFAQTQTRAGQALSNVQYKSGAVVSSGGTNYVSIQNNNINHAPPNATWWKPLAAGAIVGPSGFQQTDIGRLMRLFAEPAAWLAATAYTKGQLAKYQDAYYVALQASTGKVPGTDPDNWGVAANAAAWTWGIITAVAGPTQVSLQLQGGDLLYNQNILLWRLGVYADSTAYPSAGAFHEGRFWLGGAVKNRFDASSARGNPFDFSPTAADGTVSDANGISYTLKSKQQNLILWMTPALGGILMGTAQCEWLVQSSANNDPITPTNIQAHDHTAIGSANVDVVRCGPTIAFVQRYGNKVMEYLADVFSGKPAGKNLTQRAKHLTGAGIQRLAYQQELVPILWAITNDNKLIGTTYKRESLMVSQPPEFNAWHRHDLGSGWNVIDLVVSGSPSGLYETATIISQDPDTLVCRVEAVTDLFQETSTVQDSWFVDAGVIPSGGESTVVNGIAGIQFTGLAALESETVSAFIAGLDLGDFLVTNGRIFCPYGCDSEQRFTLALVQALAQTGRYFNHNFQIRTYNGATVQTMMEFPPVAASAGYTYLEYGAQAICDWAHDRVDFFLTGSVPTSGIVQYRISTGALIQYKTIDQIFGSPIPPFFNNATVYAANPAVIGSDGKIYIAVVSNSHGIDPLSAGQTDWQTWTNAVAPAAYNGATAYSLNNLVTSAGAIYISLQNANTGHTPASSPTFWQFVMATPSVWSSSTTYGTAITVMGSNAHIYWPVGAVPAGLGDPTGFTQNANAYWGSNGGSWTVARINKDGLSIDGNGDIWMYQSGTTIGSTYVKINGSTLKLSGFVTAAAGLSIPVPSNYSVPMVIQNNASQPEAQMLLETVDTTPSGSTAPSAILMDVSSMRISSTTVFTFDEGNSPIACAGSSQIGTARAYVLTRPLAGQATTAAVGLYEISAYSNNPNTLVKNNLIGYWGDPNKARPGLYDNVKLAPQTKRKVGTITPQSIDPLWTFFTGFTGLMFDPYDGNVMSFVGTQNPAVWDTSQRFQSSGATVLSYTLGSDNNVYRYVPPALYSAVTTYAINQVVQDGATSQTMYKSLANGNTGNALSDPTKWVVFTQDPVTDATHTYWTLVRAKATTLFYLLKMSTDCARKIWNIPVANAPCIDIGFPSINISTGYYDFLESLGLGAWQVRRIYTLTGKDTILYAGQAGNAQLGSVQMFNGNTGDIILYTQYDSTAGGTSAPPTRVDPVGGTTPVSFTNWGRLNVLAPYYDYTTAGVAGFTFTSQGQLLRPVSPAESGARNGPAFGKTRRNHRYAAALANTIGQAGGIHFGSDFSKLRPALLATAGNTKYASNALYTGEHSATLEDTYSYDGMVCWQINRPVAGTVTALGGFLETQDR